MPNYKLLIGTHTLNGLTYKAGHKGEDILELTIEQAARMGKRVEPVSANSEEPVVVTVVDPAITEEEITIPDLLLKPLVEIKTQLGMVNDIGTLDAVQAEEQKGKRRADVLKAIDVRRKALK